MTTKGEKMKTLRIMIWEEEDVLLAKGSGFTSFITQGKDEEELKEMIVDALMTCWDINPLHYITFHSVKNLFRRIK